MKYTYCIAIFACLFLLLQACGQNDENNIIPDTNAAAPVPLNYAYIVKLSSIEYLDYVVAVETFDGNNYSLRWINGVCQELFLGTSPYIELVDGYYLIDWKWGHYHSAGANNLFLIDVKWTDILDVNDKWDKNTLITKNFLEVLGSISYKQIDEYLKIEAPTHMNKAYNTPEDYVRPWWVGLFRTISDLQQANLISYDKYKEQIKYQDSLQNVYKERMTKIITDGALENARVYIYN